MSKIFIISDTIHHGLPKYSNMKSIRTRTWHSSKFKLNLLHRLFFTFYYTDLKYKIWKINIENENVWRFIILILYSYVYTTCIILYLQLLSTTYVFSTHNTYFLHLIAKIYYLSKIFIYFGIVRKSKKKYLLQLIPYWHSYSMGYYSL